MSLNLQDGLFDLITTEATIAAIIATRMYPIVLPTDCPMPALRYSFAGGMSEPTFDTSGLQRVRVQFDCFGANQDDAMQLRWALIRFLNGYSGELIDGTVLQLAQLIQQVDFFEQGPRQFRCMVEFYLTFNFNF